MELTWMGRHRKAVESIIRFGNTYAQVVNLQGYLPCNVRMSAWELQVLEYLLENEDRHENMSCIAGRLQVSQSSFSKSVKQLVAKGLLEKYHTKSNSKNVIIKVSDLGRQVYADYSVSVSKRWTQTFAELDKLSPDDEETFCRVLTSLSDNIVKNHRKYNESEDDDAALIRIE